MCGIVGFVTRNGSGVSPQTEARSLEALAHRGPDDRGAWTNNGVALGATRLSIIDLAGGHQPLWNEDHSLCIVYNGELYNFLDLRPALEARGHVFRTRSDTEVVLHAYEEWGPDCLLRFNGMFAFAIWSESEKQLFLARDRIGEKPLYYYQSNGLFAFASEIKAMLRAPEIPRRLSLEGLSNFLAFGHAVAPQTMFADIHKLLPGHYLTLRDGNIQTVQYWDVGCEVQIGTGSIPSEDWLSKCILQLLDDSVQRRMVADVPVGAFLSGGVDSGAVVALMQRHAASPVKTFSLGFSGSRYSELPEARQLAAHYGTEHYELKPQPTDLVGALNTLVYHYDEPFGDAAGFPIYLLSRFAREHVKVVLTGDGGDELFGGYRRYVVDQLSGLYGRLPRTVTRDWIPSLVDRLPRLRRTKRTVQTLPNPDPANRYASWLSVFNREMQKALLHADLWSELSEYDPAWQHLQYYDRLNHTRAPDQLNRMMYVDVKTLLVDGYLEKTDKATMAASLEARLPLLDHRLVELAFQIPGRYKIRGVSTKRILKRAVRELVPDEVLKRRKHGFSVPTDPWFRGDLRAFTFDVLLDERARRRGYFNMAFIERLWREHGAGRHVWDTQLWLLLNFELWHRMYLDGDPV